MAILLSTEKWKWKSFSHVQLFGTPWTVACQAPLSMGFSRQEYWSGLPFPSPWDLPDLGIKPRSPALQADSLPSELPGKPQTYHNIKYIIISLFIAQCPSHPWGQKSVLFGSPTMFEFFISIRGPTNSREINECIKFLERKSRCMCEL